MLVDLYSGEIDGMFVSSHYPSMFSGITGYENIETDTKVIISKSKKMKKASSSSVETASSGKSITEPFTILLMGIDQRTEQVKEQKSESGGSGQADAIVLLTIDSEAQTMKLTAIPRDTITEISVRDASGNSAGKSKNHLALAYAYGDGGMESGELSVEAVSNLLYQLPIHGFAAIRMDAVEKLNDSVGGVTVTVPEAMEMNGITYEAGQTLNLTGSQALSYVRARDMEAAGANLQRMERWTPLPASDCFFRYIADRRNRPHLRLPEDKAPVKH